MKRLFAFFVFLTALIACVSHANAADWTYVQGNNANGAASSKTTMLTSVVGSGHVIVGTALWNADAGNNNIPPTSITDDKNNQYIIAGYYPGATAGTLFSFVSKGLITNGPQNFTLTLSGTPTSYTFLFIDEFAPPTGTSAISLDGTTIMPGGNWGTTSQAFQTIHNDALLWGISLAGSSTVGAGFTQGQAGLTEYKIQATASNSNTIVFGTNTNWGAGFGIAPVAATAATDVQMTTSNILNNVNTVSATFVNTVSFGNYVMVGTGAIPQGSITGITDDQGNSYSLIVYDATLQHGIFWSNKRLINNPKTITLTSTGGPYVAVLTATEFAPPPGFGLQLDNSVDGSYNSTAVTTLTTPNLTTTKPNELIWSWISSGASIGDLPQNGFSALNNMNQKNSDSYFIQQSAGTIAATWTFGSSGTIALFAASFILVPGAGGFARVGNDGVNSLQSVGGLLGGISN